MKLSIITINYNNANGLRKTMESVLNQTLQSFEYLIVDGASNDESVAIIKQFEIEYQRRNSKVQFSWISEPDSGIYNAMNKGIELAKGEFLQFLNSGDWLVNNDVVENTTNSLSNCDILVGNTISVRKDGKMRHNKSSKDISLLTFYRSTIQHPSAFIKKSLLNKYGRYDESLKIVSDWKFFLLAVGLNSARVEFSNIDVTFFDTSGISSNNMILEKVERRRVLESLIPKPTLNDYDKYHVMIDQMKRIKKYKCIYYIFWFVERCLFKIEKYNIRYFGWRSV